MRTIIFIILALITMEGAAQKIKYPFTGNTGERKFLEPDSMRYSRDYEPVRKQFKSLKGAWISQQDSLFRFLLQYKIKHFEVGSYKDKCFAIIVGHPDFHEKFELRVRPLDINNLNKFYFSIMPDGRIGTKGNQVYVSGYLYIVDKNTLRMEVKGVEHPPADDEGVIVRPDYKISEAPADVLERVPDILLNGPFIFKRRQ